VGFYETAAILLEGGCPQPPLAVDSPLAAAEDIRPPNNRSFMLIERGQKKDPLVASMKQLVCSDVASVRFIAHKTFDHSVLQLS